MTSTQASIEHRASSRAYKALSAGMAALGEVTSSVDPRLAELIKTRASQLNGCAYCIDLHTKDALARGETAQRLFALTSWRETSFFSEAERAALALTEAVTEMHPHEAIDAAWDEAAEYFEQDELSAILLAIIAINSWNRFAITTHSVPGSYRPDLVR